MVVHGHLVKAIEPGHRKSKHARAVRILTKVYTADHQIFIDNLEDIVKALPRRIQIAKENVIARLESAVAVPHLDCDRLQAVARLDAAIGVAGDTRVLSVRLLVKFLLE